MSFSLSALERLGKATGDDPPLPAVDRKVSRQPSRSHQDEGDRLLPTHPWDGAWAMTQIPLLLCRQLRHEAGIRDLH